MSKVKIYSVRLFIILLGAAASNNTFAHPNGTSKVDMYIFPKKLELLVNVNADDILNIVIDRGSWKLNQEQRIQTCKKMAYYFENNLVIEIDGSVPGPMNVLKWPNDKEQLDDSMDSAAFAISTYIFRFSYPLEGDARSLEVRTSMFAEYEIQAISIMNVYWQDRKIMDEQYLALDNVLTIDLRPENLTAMADKQAAKAAAALKKDTGSFPLYIWIGLAVLFILAGGGVILLILSRKLRKT
jgi:hypothetical protein